LLIYVTVNIKTVVARMQA